MLNINVPVHWSRGWTYLTRITFPQPSFAAYMLAHAIIFIAFNSTPEADKFLNFLHLHPLEADVIFMKFKKDSSVFVLLRGALRSS